MTKKYDVSLTANLDTRDASASKNLNILIGSPLWCLKGFAKNKIFKKIFSLDICVLICRIKYPLTHYKEELLASGDPKYAHLKQPLHLQVHNEDDDGDTEEYEDGGAVNIDDFASIIGCFLMTIRFLTLDS